MDEPHAWQEHETPRDVVVVGGGVAGLAGALQLGRSRRSVVVVDAGAPRNAPAAHLHGYLGHDGLPPAELLRLGRDEVRAYGVEIVEGAVADVSRHPATGAFRVELAGGRVLAARRVLLATGLVDELPDIPGVAEQWGRGVIHCPYCHGWEVRDQRLAVIATDADAALHQAMLFRQLSDRVTVVEHAGHHLDAAARARLARRSIAVEAGPVAGLVVDDGNVVQGVRLADGRVIDVDAVVVRPRFVARTDAVRSLGIVAVPAPMGSGEMVATDERGETAVRGLYAAGNVSDVAGQLLQAAAQGSRVGAMINADLAEQDSDLAGSGRPDDTAEGWDVRYTEREQVWSGLPNGTLVAEVDGVVPGTALDVGCGEGADAIWLAERGWRLTAVDISPVAVERARAAGAAAGVDVDWQQVDIPDEPLGDRRYDLVSVHYPALRHTPGDDAIHAIVDAVAPGGMLLVVGHDVEAMREHAQHHGFDPEDYVKPADVAAVLGDGWTIEVDEVRPRTRPPVEGGPDVPDVVLRARRT